MNKKGDILFGIITKVGFNSLTVLTNNDYEFTIPKKMATDWNKKSLRSEFKTGEKINFIVQEIDNTNKKGVGDFKINHPLYARSPFKDCLQETKHGFETLKKSIDEQLKNVVERPKNNLDDELNDDIGDNQNA